MKKFGIMPQETMLYGHTVPKNAIYGRIAFTYDRRIKIGERFVTDKKGKMVFDKDGRPKVHNLYKTVPTKTGCVYSWEFFGTYRHKNSDLSLEVWILYDNSRKWQHVHLGDTQFTSMLQDFLLAKMKEWSANGHDFGMMADKFEQRIVGQPKRKDVQTVYMYRGNPKCWALNPNYITDNIIIDPPHSKTNMSKLHPLVESKPVVAGIGWEYDDSKAVHPTNSGFIHNEDGTITTRNGEQVKTTLPYEYTAKPNKVVENKNKNRKPARAGYHYAG